jgi:hypothetical protein
MVRKLGRIMGIKFKDTIYGKLTEDFGGHPYLVRHVCSVINRIAGRERPTEVDKQLYEKGKEVFAREYGGYMEMILGVLRDFYSDEYAMLQYLACGDHETFREFERLSPYYTNHLLGYGIIEESRGDYAFSIESLRGHLLAKHKYVRINLSNSEKLQEISERRNALEPKLRQLVRAQLAARYGKAAATDIVVAMLGETRHSKQRALSYEELFDPRLARIYWDDVRKLILKEWDCFRFIFGGDASDFGRRMETINKYRVDAHASNISDEETAYVRTCFTALEQSVSEFL